MRRYFLLLLILPFCCFGDVAGEYERYVNAVIPLTHELSKKDAFIRETAVFVDRHSVAQSHLTRASSAIGTLHHFTEQLSPMAGPDCPMTASGTIDVRKILKQITALTQVVNAFDESRNHLAAYRAIERSIQHACEDTSEFQRYQIEQVGFELHVPNGIDAADGVTLVFGSPSEKGGLGSILSFVPVIGAAIQIGQNIDQQNTIWRLERKMKAETAHTEDYQRYAQAACKQVREEMAKPAFAEQSRVASASEALLGEIPRDQILTQKNVLATCFDRFEQQVTDYFRNTAREQAETRHAAELSRIRNQKLAIALHPRINLTLLKLERMEDCSAGEDLANQADADLARLALYLAADPKETNFLSSRRERLRNWEAHCAGEALP